MQKIKYKLRFKPAFSLVEMLMALLVASLLLAALAPVMTRKMNEHITVSGTGNGIKSDYSRIFYEDFEWNVPSGVNVIKVTSVGGGGAGGGATYGYKEITSSESNWTVPEGVTKLRVFLIGGGGGGASGGQEKDFEYADIPALNNAEGEQIKEGSYTFSDGIIPPDTYKAPELHNHCRISGTKIWLLTSDNTISITPNDKINKIGGDGNIDVLISKITACGAGGGGGGYQAGGGGSGGYINEQSLNITNKAQNISLKIGSGGKGGGGAPTYVSYATATGGAGGNGYGGANGSAGKGTSIAHVSASSYNPFGGGGGGGAATTLFNGSSQVFQIGGGGGGGGGAASCGAQSTWGASGGDGGGENHGCGGGRAFATYNNSIAYGYGGGGGGGAYTGGICTAGSDAVNGSAGKGGNNGGITGRGGSGTTGTVISGTKNNGSGGGGGGYSIGCPAGQGGGGGGGLNGMGGDGNSNSGSIKGTGGAISSSIFDSSTNCSGGNAGSSGLPGAIHLWYSAASVKDGLKCEYYTKSNSGGGGGAGQIWIGELSVTPRQKLNFNIGIGGNRTNSYGSNGNDGGSTSITNNSGTTLISVSGGKGGKYESDETYINNSYGIGGGIKTSNVDSGYAKYVNWKKTNFHTGGENGGVGKTPGNGAGGGKGGQLYDLNGILLKGGSESGAQTDGSSAPSTSYGAGGSGGGGVINDGGTPGHGGKGANGYIYVEWGKTNGGGGASGQIVTENTVWVTPGTKIQITVGKGGEPQDIIENNGQLGQKGNNGTDSFVTTNEGKKAIAKGGEGGYPGTSVHGMGGNYDGKDENGNITGNKSPNYIENSVKGENATDDYGGIGGTITEEICPLFDTLMGLGGCGGNMPNGNCNGASSTGAGKNAGKVGGGGGGGAVKDNTAYTGGKGANGMVVIEWNN